MEKFIKYNMTVQYKKCIKKKKAFSSNVKQSAAFIL